MFKAAIAIAFLINGSSVFAQEKKEEGLIMERPRLVKVENLGAEVRPESGNDLQEKSSSSKAFFCKATTSSKGDNRPSSLPTGNAYDNAYDLGTVGNCSQWNYSSDFNNSCQAPAATSCSNKANLDSNFKSASFWCGRGTPNGSTIRAYAAVGQPRNEPNPFDKGDYHTAQTQGILLNTPAVTVTSCKCPTGWLGDANVNGGVITKGRCKKLACSPNIVSPFPDDGTQIGSGAAAWGFAWGNQFWALGTSANGGAPKCTTEIIQSAVCKWQ